MTVNSKENLLTVQKPDGDSVTYNPARLHGISAYREIERKFAIGDRLQFNAPNRELGVANRDLGTVELIDPSGQLSVRMDGGKSVSFDPSKMRHFDHGYAVTSHSSQGLTAERVVVNIDTEVYTELINSRFAYVAISRASNHAEIYTSDIASLASKLSHTASKSSAITLAAEQAVNITS